jgi:hypothetical protein
MDIAWAFALALAAAAVTAFVFRGRHGGWFHPLSLPLAALAVMLLGAPLWVQATGRPAGLLYAPGHLPQGASRLSAALSAAASAALVLVIAGYVAGAGLVLVLASPPRAAVPGRWAPLRYPAVRRAGSALLVSGALAHAVITIAKRGTPYGAEQVQYGVLSFLGSAAAALVLAGLAAATLIVADAPALRRARDLLGGREWAALGLYLAAVTASGDRAGLIPPGVIVAWAYSTRVRAIPFRRVAAAAVITLVAAAGIAAWRTQAPLPDSPSAVMQSAAGDVSSPPWLTEQTVSLVPSSSPFLHGSTYEAAVVAQLPGPVSRHFGATSRTASAVFRDLIGFYDPDQGFAESYPSEAYLNFGLPGCLCAGLLLGAVMAWAWRSCRHPACRPRDLLYPVLLAGFAYGLRSDALTQVKDVLYPVLIIWGVTGSCRLRPVTPGLTRLEDLVTEASAGPRS